MGKVKKTKLKKRLLADHENPGGSTKSTPFASPPDPESTLKKGKKVKKRKLNENANGADVSPLSKKAKVAASDAQVVLLKKKKKNKKQAKAARNEVAEAVPLEANEEEGPIEAVDDDLEDDNLNDSSHADGIHSGADVSDEETSDGDDEDEDEEEEDEELIRDEGTGEVLTFDFEAFPMEEGDRDGVVNMLTQIFLRAEVDLRKIADALIAQSPIGSVVGPAESCADEHAENEVYGVLSALPLDGAKDLCKDILSLILSRAKKAAPKDVLQEFEETLKSSFVWLINERMLKFPSEIAPPCFASLQNDLAGMQVDKVMYIQKLRVADPDANDVSAPGPSKRKLGKAAKKRLAREAMESAVVEYDNPEDELLLQLPQGNLKYFDYNVQGEVEPGSKFHTQVRGGKTFRPFRRAIIMDKARLYAFVEAVKNF